MHFLCCLAVLMTLELHLQYFTRTPTMSFSMYQVMHVFRDVLQELLQYMVVREYIQLILNDSFTLIGENCTSAGLSGLVLSLAPTYNHCDTCVLRRVWRAMPAKTFALYVCV